MEHFEQEINAWEDNRELFCGGRRVACESPFTPERGWSLLVTLELQIKQGGKAAEARPSSVQVCRLKQ